MKLFSFFLHFLTYHAPFFIEVVCLLVNYYVVIYSYVYICLYAFQELYCDATLACCGKYYPVHRFVLTTCSEYFEEIFERAPCKHPFIILKDVDNSQLEALLNYMYKGEVNVLQEYLPGLIRAAEALKVKGLAVSEDNYEIKKEKERKYQPCSSSKKVEPQEKMNSSLAEGEEASDSDKEMEGVDLMNKHVNSSLNFGSTSVEEMRPLSSHSNNLDESSANLSEVVEGECILEEDNEVPFVYNLFCTFFYFDFTYRLYSIVCEEIFLCRYRI
ncbi:UNVERIFIED_CONTAM: hypothetical protein GTU68_023494 [Idotea baltica]|nr:hypothetical protein [Idotea baltica]